MRFGGGGSGAGDGVAGRAAVQEPFDEAQGVAGVDAVGELGEVRLADDHAAEAGPEDEYEARSPAVVEEGGDERGQALGEEPGCVVPDAAIEVGVVDGEFRIPKPVHDLELSVEVAQGAARRAAGEADQLADRLARVPPGPGVGHDPSGAEDVVDDEGVGGEVVDLEGDPGDGACEGCFPASGGEAVHAVGERGGALFAEGVPKVLPEGGEEFVADFGDDLRIWVAARRDQEPHQAQGARVFVELRPGLVGPAVGARAPAGEAQKAGRRLGGDHGKGS